MDRLRGGLLLAVGLSSCPTVARGAEPGHLTYEAPPGCATRDEFVRAVTSRGASWPGTSGDDGRQLEVSVRPVDGGGFLGSLRLRRPGRDAGVREVRGPTCAEVADALAVVTALALREPADTPATQGSPVAADDAALPVPGPRSAPGRAEPTGEERDATDWSLTLLGGVASGYSQTRPAARFDLSLGTITASSSSTRALVVPRFAIRLIRVNSVSTHNLIGHATLGETAFAFNPCLALGPAYTGHSLSLALCGEMAIRHQSYTTRDPYTPPDYAFSDTRNVPSIGMSFGVRYALGRHVLVAADAGVDLLMGERQLAAMSEGSVLSQPLLAFHGQLGAGVRF